MSEQQKPVARISDLPKDEGFYAKHNDAAAQMASWLKVVPFYSSASSKPRQKKKKAQ